MGLPDKFASEPTTEIDADVYKAYLEAKEAVDAWTKELNRLKKKLAGDIGDAYAATVDGHKVLSYRPQVNYAEARIRQDYPDLTEHFMEYRTEMKFALDKFVQAHPEIAERYRVRSLKEVKED